MSEPVANANQDPIRRLTNQELWNSLMNGIIPAAAWTGTVEKELERRLRKIAFLPALPPKEEA
jgi:hypothetical protein